jgi:hypothetical protein
MSGLEVSTGENHTKSFVTCSVFKIYGHGLFDSSMYCSPLDYIQHRGCNSFALSWWGGRVGGGNGFYSHCHAISQTTDWIYYRVFRNGGYIRSTMWDHFSIMFHPLTPELNPSAQRCLTRFFTVDFSFWTVHFVNICVENQQMHQLFIQFINYVW